MVSVYVLVAPCVTLLGPLSVTVGRVPVLLLAWHPLQPEIEFPVMPVLLAKAGCDAATTSATTGMYFIQQLRPGRSPKHPARQEPKFLK